MAGDQSSTQLGVGNPISSSGEREKKGEKEVKPFHTLAQIMKITFERQGANPIKYTLSLIRSKLLTLELL